MHAPAVDGAALVFLQTIAGVYFLGITGVGAYIFREAIHLRDAVRIWRPATGN